MDQTWERDLLHHCLKNKVYRFEASGVLRHYDFLEPSHSWLWKQISALAPTDDVTERFMDSRIEDVRDEDERLVLEAVYKRIRGLKHTSPRAAVDELRKFVRFRQAQRAAVDLATSLERGDLEGFYKRVATCMMEDVGQTRPVVLDVIDGFEDRMEERSRKKDSGSDLFLVKTGIPTIDRAIVGIEPPSMLMVGGYTGRGKSMFATHLGIHNAFRGLNVVHFVYEMAVQRTATRYDSRLFDVAYRKFRIHDFSESELESLRESFIRMRSRLKGKMTLVKYPPSQSDVRGIESILAQRQSEGIPTDLVIVDSPDHMKSVRNHKDKRQEVSSLWWELKGVMEQFEVALVNTSQINKENAYKLARKGAASESLDKDRISDFVITLNQSQEQEDMGTEMDLFLAKNREDKGGRKVLCRIDFDRCIFQEIDDAQDYKTPASESEPSVPPDDDFPF